MNLRGAMLCYKHAIPPRLRAGDGPIVNPSFNRALAGELIRFARAAAWAEMIRRTPGGQRLRAPGDLLQRRLARPALRPPVPEAACTQEMMDAIASHNWVLRTGESEDMAQRCCFRPRTSPLSSMGTGAVHGQRTARSPLRVPSADGPDPDGPGHGQLREGNPSQSESRPGLVVMDRDHGPPPRGAAPAFPKRADPDLR